MCVSVYLSKSWSNLFHIASHESPYFFWPFESIVTTLISHCWDNYQRKRKEILVLQAYNACFSQNFGDFGHRCIWKLVNTRNKYWSFYVVRSSQSIINFNGKPFKIVQYHCTDLLTFFMPIGWMENEVFYIEELSLINFKALIMWTLLFGANCLQTLPWEWLTTFHLLMYSSSQLTSLSNYW